MGHTKYRVGKTAGDLHWVGQNKFSEVTPRAKDSSPYGEVFWAGRTDFCLERIFQAGVCLPYKRWEDLR